MKNNLYILSLFFCCLIAGCNKKEIQHPANPHIKVISNDIDILLGLTRPLNVQHDVKIGFMCDNWDIVPLPTSQINDDGSRTFFLKGQKLGNTKIHISESLTGNYEVIVNVYCSLFSGYFREYVDYVPDNEKPYEVDVIADDPQIESTIRSELLAKCYVRYGTEYYFNSTDMTFEMLIPSNATKYKGTYEHNEFGQLILLYNGTTENYFLSYHDNNFYIETDYRDEYQKKYPGHTIIKAHCRRSLSPIKFL